MAWLVMVMCGAAYGACFPPLAWRPLAWVVLVPALLMIRRAAPARAAALGALLAFAGACVTVAWLPRTVVTYFAQPWPIGAALFLAVTALMVLPYYAGVAALLSAAARRWPGAPLVVLGAAAWVAGEFLRSTLLGGNPWVLWGYSQPAWSAIAQLADLTSVYGVTFVLAAATLALVEAWALRASPRRAGAALLVGALLVGPPLAYGRWRLAHADEPRASTAVLIAQGNLDLGTQWQPEFYGQNLDVYLRLTLDALRAAPAALVVWPESALTFFVADEPLHQEAIARVLGPFGATLLTGGPAVHRDDGRERFTNAAFTLTPDGSVTAQYDKRRLLPFAEYLPFGEIDLLHRQFGKVRAFVAGTPGLPLPTPAGAAGVLICNEALFPADARARVAEGATLLVNLSNDTWMRDAQFSTIAFDMSALRAVEQRRWLIRASTSGPSAIIDAYGRVRVGTALDQRTTVQGRVAPRLERSPYSRWGDVFAWSCVALTGLTTALLRRR